MDGLPPRGHSTLLGRIEPVPGSFAGEPAGLGGSRGAQPVPSSSSLHPAVSLHDTFVVCIIGFPVAVSEKSCGHAPLSSGVEPIPIALEQLPSRTMLSVCADVVPSVVFEKPSWFWGRGGIVGFLCIVWDCVWGGAFDRGAFYCCAIYCIRLAGSVRRGLILGFSRDVVAREGRRCVCGIV